MYKILVVDDNKSICKMMAKHLIKRNHKVLLAESGREALSILSDEKVSLILLDQMMPDMDGMETFAKIKKKFGEDAPPVIMFTAHGSMDLALSFMKDGGADFTIKPIDFEILEVKIHQVVGAYNDHRTVKEQADRLIKLDAIQLVARTVSHEINNALNSISMALLLLEKIPDTEKGREIIGIEIKRISGFIKRIHENNSINTFEYAGGNQILNIVTKAKEVG